MKELGKLKYFFGIEVSPRKGRSFRKEGTLSMKIYIDADYTGSVVDQRSTFGCCIFLGGNLVIWRSKKQNMVARSSVEAEFQTMAHDICKELWMKIILDDLKVKYEGPMNLLCDNNSAISISHNPIQQHRTKNIEIDRHFIKEKLDSGLIVTTHVLTGLQVADIFKFGTKDGKPADNLLRKHSYVLQPVTGNAKYSKLLPTEVADSKQPLQKAVVNLDDVTISLSKDGYGDIMKLADNFAAFNQRLKYAHYRPLVPVKADSRSWWKYAYRAVSDQIKKARMLAHKFVEQSAESNHNLRQQKARKSWWSFGW
ncbi:Copia protein, partial [Mucuna pruriens]